MYLIQYVLGAIKCQRKIEGNFTNRFKMLQRMSVMNKCHKDGRPKDRICLHTIEEYYT